MIVGTVQPGGDAVVPVRVRGERAAPENQVVVDSGFNDWLVLARDAIEALGLTFREEGRFTLADGSVAA